MARLGDIATVITKGTTPTSVGFEFCDRGINFIKIESISEDGSFIPSKFAHISEGCDKKLARSQLKENDILFSIAGAIGRCAIVSKDILPANTNQALAIIRIPEGVINYKYLLYLLRSPDLVKQSNKQKQGVAQLNLSLQNVGDFVVPIKSSQEQHRIVSIIDKLNSLIALRKQQLAKLDELVKARFVEMFGDLADPCCKFQKCSLSEACLDADDIKCGPFGTQLSKDEYQDEGIAVWEIPQINSGFATKPTHFLTAEKAEQLKAYSIEPGDIAMSRKGNVGKCALFPDGYEPGIIHSDVLRIRVDSKRVVPCFMMYQLHFSREVQRQIEVVSSGAIMAGVNVTKLKQIEVYVPEYGTQEGFAAFVRTVDRQKLTIQKSLGKIDVLKKSLIQEYFG